MKRLFKINYYYLVALLLVGEKAIQMFNSAAYRL